jgi:hypothetical protein
MHREPIETGQLQVEQHDVRMRAQRLGQALLAIGQPRHEHAVRLQIAHGQLAEAFVVFDQNGANVGGAARRLLYQGSA